MSPHELYMRLRQAASGRADAWRHRLGRPPTQPARSSGAPARGKFFFAPSDAQTLAREWAARSPQAVEQLVARAQKIAQHRFSLLGYEDLNFGDPIDWHLDPVHGVRAPMVPWRQVPYLDFRAVGDHKVIWELSRHQHLTALVRASLYTGERRWTQEAVAQWRDWQKQNPYPLGIHWASSLEVAFRVLSWIWIEHFLAADADAAEFRHELAGAIGHSASFIERHLSTYFAPNTHLLGEGVALLFAGLLYREFRDASRWRDAGWRIVLEQAREQVREDGFHFEQSTYYHVYALDFFLHARILAANNGLQSPELHTAIERMAAALLGISQAGAVPRFGDDDGGRVFDGSRNRGASLLDPLATAAAIFDRPEWKTGELPEESWWLLGSDEARRFDRIERGSRELRTCAFRASGYYAMAGADALLVADAGPHGFGRGGHGHADALSVQLLADGEALLSDPGTGAYPVELPIRNGLRGSAAHNTLTVDSLDQAEPAGPFAWSTQPVTTVERWQAGRAMDLWIASHDGYRRLADPVIHRRSIVRWKSAGWLIHDRALHQTATHQHRFDVHWHLGPGAQSVAPGEAGLCFRYPSGAEVKLTVEENSGWEAQVEEGEFSPAYGSVVTAPVVRLSREADAPVEIATVVIASGGSDPDPRLRKLGPAAGAIYEWSDAEGVRFVWFGDGGDRETSGWRTDATFVLIALDAVGAVEGFVLAGGTFFETGGRVVFRSAQPVDFLEWLAGDAIPAGEWNPQGFTAPEV